MSDEIRKQAEMEAQAVLKDVHDNDGDNDDLFYGYASAIERHLRTIAELSKKASAWNRVKSICCGDGTFLKREHIEEIERQEAK